MVDLARAYEEAKSLPDEALSNELANPSGFLPGYIVMSELEDRKALRASGGGQAPQGSMKDELLSSLGPVRQYAQGGIVAQLNPGYARMLGLQSPEMAMQLAQQSNMDASGGIMQLAPPQAMGAPQAAPSLNSLVATAPSDPQKPKSLGLASLRR